MKQVKILKLFLCHSHLSIAITISTTRPLAEYSSRGVTGQAAATPPAAHVPCHCTSTVCTSRDSASFLAPLPWADYSRHAALEFAHVSCRRRRKVAVVDAFSQQGDALTRDVIGSGVAHGRFRTHKDKELLSAAESSVE
jgi:hypothetical protein